MASSDPPNPRRPKPPPLTPLEKLTFPEHGYGTSGRLRTGIYDYPDGEYCFSKIFKSVRLATIVASFASLVDIGIFNQPRSPAMLASRYLYTVLPAASAAAVFTSTNCVVGSMRNKDDSYNHAVGGCLGGAVLVSGTGRVTTALGACAIGGFLAALNKSLMMQDIDITRARIYRIDGSIGHEERYFGWRSSKPGAFTSVAKEPTDY